MHIYKCVHAYMCTMYMPCAHKGQKWALNPLDLQAVVNCLDWMLGMELRPVKAARTQVRVTSSAPSACFYAGCILTEAFKSPVLLWQRRDTRY